MNILIKIDHTLFHFINDTIANPLLNWVMPIVTNENNIAIPLVLFWLWLLLFQGKRGKIAAIVLLLTVILTDIIAAFGKTTHPVDYDALDGEPVHLVFLLVGKDTLVSKHIKSLSRISRLMNKDDFRQKLVDAKSKNEILKIFEEEEKNYSDV